MEFRILGALEAGSGSTVVDLGSPKQRALFAVLLLHVGEIVPIDRLIDMVWGEDPPRTADHSVQIYVSELRKALATAFGTPLILRRPPGYQLDVPTDSVDANRFEDRVREGAELLAAGERDQAVDLLRSALALWRGPALSDFAYEDFAQPYVRSLNDLHLDAIEHLASAELEGGTPSAAISLLEAAIREDPLRERSRELLMVALYRTGRHAEALRTYDQLRELLVEELGLEPSPPLLQLRDRVLLHDPTLMPSNVTEPAVAARNPYKGLKPFGEHDAEDFHGRETLIAQLLASLEGDQRFITLVGPSGSGKSSVIAAGLIPRLRAGAISGSADWHIATVALGPDPVAEVRAVLRVLPGAGAAPPDDVLPRPTVGAGSRLVLVIDQFEQLFNSGDDPRRLELLGALAAAVRDSSAMTLVVTLRADFYDRPLQRPEISDLFVQGVVHVLPMTARELEVAISEPAGRVGVQVEPGLLGELVAETIAHPGSLPLLQYALTELFEQRSGAILTHAGYAALGGLRGVLTRRAEAVYLGLDAEGQRIATQMFLRLVRPGRGTADSRRRTSVAELTDLTDDSVALSEVVTAFGHHRLLTFDRDPASGQATVELAHEALLTEWDRLSAWIDRHRAALRRREALLNAVDEWELADRNPDYLLTGSRLDEFAEWSREGSLQPTHRELAFLDAGLDRRREEAAALASAQRMQRQRARTARLRLIGLGAAVFVFAGVAAFAIFAAPPPLPKPVAFLWTDSSIVNGLSVDGFDRAVADYRLVAEKHSAEEVDARLAAQLGADWKPASTYEYLQRVQDEGSVQTREVAASGAGLVVIQNMAIDAVDAVAADYPHVYFVAGDGIGTQPNVAYLLFKDAEPSFLAGAVAAMKSETGIIGFIGGVDFPVIWPFEAGFVQGARHINPDIQIRRNYLSTFDDFSGFASPRSAQESALAMYRSGADIIFHAAGDSGVGLFQAATEFSRSSQRQVWAIGVDSDQWETVSRLPGVIDPEAYQVHILTSVLKPIGQMTYAALETYAKGEFVAGVWNWGLADIQGVGIAFSGGYVGDIRPEVETLQAQIINGSIVVDCVSDMRRDIAARWGFPEDYCR